MRFLETFILKVPYLLLKKIPYAWLGVIFFWVWPPVLFYWILIAIVIIGLLMIDWQRRAWEVQLICEHHAGPEKPFIDRPKMPLNLQLRNLVLLALGSGLAAWLFQGQFELNFWQWFFFFYREFYRAQRIQVPRKRTARWSQLTPTSQPPEGVLLTPRNLNGFSRQLEPEILLAPVEFSEFSLLASTQPDE